MENKVIGQIPEQVITEVTTKLQEITMLFNPYLIALTPKERSELPKMSDGTLPFVFKCLSYCQLNPEFAPAYINFNDLSNDMDVFEKLLPIYRMVVQLENKLNDTSMQAGSESFVSSLSYYNSVKSAAKYDAPGAKAIYEDLKKRFERTSAPDPVPVL